MAELFSDSLPRAPNDFPLRAVIALLFFLITDHCSLFTAPRFLLLTPAASALLAFTPRSSLLRFPLLAARTFFAVSTSFLICALSSSGPEKRRSSRILSMNLMVIGLP